MKNQPLDPQRKKEMTELVNEFIRGLRKVKTVEELGSLLIKLTDFNLVGEIESKWMAERLKKRIALLGESDQCKERGAVYALVYGLIILQIFTENVQQKLSKFHQDTDKMIDELFR